MRRIVEFLLLCVVLGAIILAVGRMLGVSPSAGEILLVSVLYYVWDEVYDTTHDRELQRQWVSRNRKRE